MTKFGPTFRPTASRGLNSGRLSLLAPIVLVILALADPTSAAAKRTKPGPTFTRGTITSVSKANVRFTSPTKGTFTAVISKLTEFTEHEKKISRPHFTVGMHIGVHGYVTKRTIRAISVTIYPSTKKAVPKESTLRGYVVKHGVSWLEARLGSHRYRFSVPATAKITYRLHPAKLSTAKHGERVNVRYYRSNGKFIATSILLLVVHKTHPRLHVIYGIVTSTTENGFKFDELSGKTVTVEFGGNITAFERASVHCYEKQHRIIAMSVLPLQQLPVHTKLVRGTVRSRTATGLELNSGRHFTAMPWTKVTKGTTQVSFAAVHRGSYVSVRCWQQGERWVANDIHIYASPPVPSADGSIIGAVLRISLAKLEVRTQRSDRTLVLSKSSTARTSKGHEAVQDVKPGDFVKVSYFARHDNITAISIYVYSSAPLPTKTGTIAFIERGSVTYFTAGHLLRIGLTGRTIVVKHGHLAAKSTLEVGQAVSIVEESAVRSAFEIQTMPQGSNREVNSNPSFSGTVQLVRKHSLQLQLAPSRSIWLRLNAQTHIESASIAIPIAWVIRGATLRAESLPGRNGAILRFGNYIPTIHTLGGLILNRVEDQLHLAARSGSCAVLAARAHVSNNGKSISDRRLVPGEYIETEGFYLSPTQLAAVTVTVSHSRIRLSGTVASVAKAKVKVTRSTGISYTLYVPPTVKILSDPTAQIFKTSHLPIGSSLSAEGTYGNGSIIVQSATVTLRSSVVKGTANSLPGHKTVIVGTTGGPITIRSNMATKVTIGRDPQSFASIQITDNLEVRAYPDATGGQLATTIDIQRPEVTRTGIVSELSTASFQVTGRTGSDVLVRVDANTEFLDGSKIVKASKLKNGDKVTVTGHLAPDGTIDGTGFRYFQANDWILTMCFDDGASPPIEAINGTGAAGGDIDLRAVDGTRFMGYLAEPGGTPSRQVIILPDIRGLHDFYRRLADRFAEKGHRALAIDYFGRTAADDDRTDQFEFMPHVQAMTPDSFEQDLNAATAAIRSRGDIDTFTVGFCYGGSLSFWSSTRRLGLAGVIGFYAGFGARGARVSPLEYASDVACPLLGLFGGADESIPQSVLDEFDEKLTAARVPHEIIVYPGAPHSFFDRRAEQYADASSDAWRRVQEFITSKQLPSV